MRAATLFGIVFLSTLRSWYFLGAGFSADNFALGGFALLVLFWPRVLRSIPRTSLWVAAGVLVALVGGVAVTFMAESDLIKIATPLSIAVFSLCGVLASGLASQRRWVPAIESALKYTVIIHAAFLFTQLLARVVLDQQIDFHVLVTGEQSRNEGGAADNLGVGVYYRPSGLLNEPGTYAAWILPLIALYITIRNYRSDWVTVIGLLSVFATFSSHGGIAAAVVASVLLYKNRGWYSSVALPVFGIAAFAALYFAVWKRFIVAGYLADESAMIRLASFESTFTTVMGNGFLFPTVAIAENTTILYWWWYCGIWCAPLLVVFGFLALKNWRDLALVFFVLLSSKVPASAPFYWLVIGLGLGLATIRSRGEARGFGTDSKRVPQAIR